MKQICLDLEKQYQEFDDLVAGLTKEQWYEKTPGLQWTIYDQVAHITFFDHEALLSIENLSLFKKRAEKFMNVIRAGQSWRAYVNPLLDAGTPEKILTLWRDIRIRLMLRLSKMSPRDRMAWYGPDMAARSMATARLMETWAHSQDVFDTLAIKRVNCHRLYHIAHIGVKTFAWSFIIKEQRVPQIKPHVELTGPSGELWKWGESTSTQRVWGSAKDFCLVVTQRRNIADTQLKWQGEDAKKWLTIAQAFAGVSQEHPAPGLGVVEYKS